MLRVWNLRFKSLPKKWIPVMEVIGCPISLFGYKNNKLPPQKKSPSEKKDISFFNPLIFRGKLIVLGRVNNFGERKTLLMSSEDHIFDNLTRRISRQSEIL